MNVEEIENYLAQKKDNFDLRYLNHIEEYKKIAVANNDENLANYLWCLHMIGTIQSTFLSMYALLKSKEKHQNAWNLLERIDIDLSALRPHFDCNNDNYFLLYIGNIIQEYEKLFPYFIFTSREGIIKKEICSICGNVVSLRNSCGHDVGNLYMGEMCCRIVEDYELLSISLVEKPFDKYGVLTPQDKEYNYFMLDNLMDNISSAYDKFYVEISIIKNPKYKSAERNKSCPCNSGKKYKKCCYGTKNELLEHHEVIYTNNPNAKPVPMIIGSTWK